MYIYVSFDKIFKNYCLSKKRIVFSKIYFYFRIDTFLNFPRWLYHFGLADLVHPPPLWPWSGLKINFKTPAELSKVVKIHKVLWNSFNQSSFLSLGFNWQPYSALLMVQDHWKAGVCTCCRTGSIIDRLSSFFTSVLIAIFEWFSPSKWILGLNSECLFPSLSFLMLTLFYTLV